MPLVAAPSCLSPRLEDSAATLAGGDRASRKCRASGCASSAQMLPQQAEAAPPPPSTCPRPPRGSAGATAAAPAPSGLEVEQITRPGGGRGLSLGVRQGRSERSCIVGRAQREGSPRDPEALAGYGTRGHLWKPGVPSQRAKAPPLSHCDTCSTPLGQRWGPLGALGVTMAQGVCANGPDAPAT